MRSFRSEVYKLLRDRHLLSPNLNRALEKGFLQRPESAYKWAEYFREKPWPEGEGVIAGDAFYSYIYAKNTLQYNRFPKGEPTIMKNPEIAVDYAHAIIDGPWPEAEDQIAQDAQASVRYSRYTLKAPFPKGEDEISKDPEAAFEYAKWVSRPFLKGEEAIATNPELSYYYAAQILKGPFPKGEPAMALSEEYAYYYAILVLRVRFKAAEPMLANSYRFSHWYASMVLGLDLDGEQRWKNGKAARKWERDHSTPF